MTEPRATDSHSVSAPMKATVSSVPVSVGDVVDAGAVMVVLEVMKMEHPLTATMRARVESIAVEVGDAVSEGQALITLRVVSDGHLAGDVPSRGGSAGSGSDGHAVAELGSRPDDETGPAPVPVVGADPSSAGSRSPVGASTSEVSKGGSPTGGGISAGTDGSRPGERADLVELRRRRSLLNDDARPEAVAKRHARGQRTARENVADLVDPGSFQEYGGFAFAAQESRRDREELQARTPADGLVTGLATVNADLVGPERSACAVVAYDYTVLAGTQGHRNHAKKDRMFELAERMRLPVVLFAEGGGGRPGDTDMPIVAGLDTRAFELFAKLSGHVPTVGIVAGRCFAGNAALLGCCDIVIATADSNIGMGGPAMIEGGGLGTFAPEEIGPIHVQVANGVVDVAVADEAEAVAVAKRYLSYFQGPVGEWTAPDQERLRTLVPTNRKQIYDVRAVVHGLADEGSSLELRSGFGAGMVTALVRLEGDPIGVLANDPRHLGGAIDSDSADKAARFLQLCDAHRLPVLYLCDTPGFMVGPEAETTAQVRHFSRMFVTAASMTVPFGTVVLRKGYGLGAQSMAGGSFKAGLFTLSWPTGEFGGMGLEGAVKLGFRRELDAIEDPVARQEAFDHMVAAAYRHGEALNMAAHLEIDDVIDPVETRSRVLAAFRADRSERRGRRNIDTW